MIVFEANPISGHTRLDLNSGPSDHKADVDPLDHKISVITPVFFRVCVETMDIVR